MAIAVRDKLRKHRAHDAGSATSSLFSSSFHSHSFTSSHSFSPGANLKGIEDAVKDHLHSAFPDLTIATLIGGAIGASSYSSLDQKNPAATNVVVLWLSDITDIDSKMMTFVRNDTKDVEGVFQHLYRVDFSAKLN